MAKGRGDGFEDSDEFREIQQKLGRKIRKLRMARGLNQKQLAVLAEVSPANYAVIEAGAGNATLLVLARVAKALAVPVAKLFEDTAGVTSGIDGVIVRLLAEMDRVRRHMDMRSDELSQFSDELRAFLDLNRNALNDIAAAGELSPIDRGKHS
jgi:transcriptional regulator with XRE-family HTH domain